jgi:hypothetical protein
VKQRTWLYSDDFGMICVSVDYGTHDLQTMNEVRAVDGHVCLARVIELADPITTADSPVESDIGTHRSAF